MMLKTQTKRTAATVALLILIFAAGVYVARRSGTDYRAYGNDFSVYYFASTELMSGRDPYQNSLGPSTPYLYPPLLAELLIPLALLPLPIAAYLWFLISTTALIAALAMSASLASAYNGQEATIAVEPGAVTAKGVSESLVASPPLVAALVALAVVGRFVLDTFNMGQVNTVVTALAVAHVYLYARGKPRGSAVVLALAASIKLLPALLILYHLARGRFRFGLVCSLLIGGSILVGFAPLGRGAPDSARTFFTRTIGNRQGFDLSYHGNQSIRGALARLGGETDETRRNPSSLVGGLAALILLGLACWNARFAGTDLAAASPFFCCMLLVSPLTWKNPYVLMILPVAFAWHLFRATASAGAGPQEETPDFSVRPLNHEVSPRPQHPPQETPDFSPGSVSFDLTPPGSASKRYPGLQSGESQVPPNAPRSASQRYPGLQSGEPQFRPKRTFIHRTALGLALAISFLLFNATSPGFIGVSAAEWADQHSLVAGGALLIFCAIVSVRRL
jgi:hypothetical protein